MKEIGIGIIGGGYMGKAHAVAMRAVSAVFTLDIHPRLEMVCASSEASAQQYKELYGFTRATANWQELVNDQRVEAVVIAAPQELHKAIALEACGLGKPVFCEKPMGTSVDDSRSMVEGAEKSGVVNMVGYNYIRTPASQFALQLLKEQAIGDITWFRGEHTEDFYADPETPASWRTQGMANGAIGDLSVHIINAALALMGPISHVMADIETIHSIRPTAALKTNKAITQEQVTNDDHGQIMCRFSSGTMGHIYFSRTATGRKMGYCYEISGTKGAIRFDQEDQNALWLYRAEGAEAERGFRKILTGPSHPNYGAFCQGPGHGTGYQDQIIIEARDFLNAIISGTSVWPTFRDGLQVNQVVDAAMRSSQGKSWQSVNES